MEKCIRYSIFVLSIALFISGYLYMVFKESVAFNIMLDGVLLLFISNIIYSFERIKSRIYFLFFNIVVFVFLIGRPTIDMFKSDVWWMIGHDATIWALSAVFISLLTLFIGALLTEKLVDNNEIRKEKIRKHVTYNEVLKTKEFKEDFIVSLRIISLILFYVSIGCFFLYQAEQLLFMRGREYVEYYTEFETKLPHILLSISDSYKLFLCIFLATFPRKKIAFLPLMMYLISAIPALMIGIRGPIVLNFIFVFLYYALRDIMQDREKWLGYFEKTAVVIFAPAGIIFLGAYNYIREGNEVTQNSVFDLILDFIHKQGVSFNTLCIGYNSLPKIEKNGFVNYTFGGLIDYFTHGTVAQKFFGAEALPSGNNLTMALKSNSFAHRMSYVARGQEYLDGHGWGSSYLLETFADYGFVGIIIFSLCLGALLMLFIPAIKKNWCLAAYTFMILTTIYFSPRDAATGWITFAFTLQFIVVLVFTYLMACLCTKRYSFGIRKSCVTRILNLERK